MSKIKTKNKVKQKTPKVNPLLEAFRKKQTKHNVNQFRPTSNFKPINAKYGKRGDR